MAWAVLQTKYPTRLEVPQDEWNKLVAEIEGREKMKAEGNVVRDLGGLHVIGTERHEARRIDLQLRGRCGRQGDPGSSRFFLSLEDDLMRIFAGEWVKNVLTRLGMQEGEAIESRMVSRRIEGAQKKVEERKLPRFAKNLLELRRGDGRAAQARVRLPPAAARRRELQVRDSRYDQQARRTPARRDSRPRLRHDYLRRLAGRILGVELQPGDFRGLDGQAPSAWPATKPSVRIETQLHDAIEENLPDGEDESEWNWEGVGEVRRYSSASSRIRNFCRSQAETESSGNRIEVLAAVAQIDVLDGVSDLSIKSSAT